jgi:hypothetical protein
MLKEIREGAPNAKITILIATGCHRGTTKDELIDKFGKEIVENENIYIHDCDEKHIYRIKNLCDVHKKLFDKVNPETMWNSKGTHERDGLVSHLDTRETEIRGVWQLPIRKRLKLHIRLLWLLKDYNIAESMDWLNEVDIRKL